MKIKLGRRVGGLTSAPAAAPEKPARPRDHERTSPRADTARRCPTWTELDPADLVKRGRFLVSAATDDAYTPYLGHVWYRDHDRIEFGHYAPLFFTVDQHGDVRVLERYGLTWSQIIASQASVG
jgi:hypothetical protein